MDSATLLHHVRQVLGVRDIYALSFLYGQRHSRELEMAAWQARAACVTRHVTLDLSFFGNMTRDASVLTGGERPVPDLAEMGRGEREQPRTYVPNRNMVFLSLAASYAETIGARDVFYGAQAQDEYGYWDCSVDFVERINHLLRLNRRDPVRIHAPFVGLTKAQVLKAGLALGVDYSHTWTCYRGGASACGTCPSCAERGKAFREAGVPDPVAPEHGVV
jgi:7-cyano-7-deazaguanine synthase